MTRYYGEWGEVPLDGDVAPFSTINPERQASERGNRRHHFVSITYMNGFTDERGRIQAYRLDDPGNPHACRPAAIGYENHYYSQELPDGGRESHRFEDLWHPIESVWPVTVRALRDQRTSPAISFNVLGMLAVMRSRVPAARDRHALLLEAELRSGVVALEELGALPDELERYADQLDTVPVGINPQRTLLAMASEFKDTGRLCFRLGFEVLHNRTGTPFLTSDNPVCSYDPREPVHARTPYDHSGEIEIVFPIAADMMLRGTSRRGPVNAISRHRDVTDRLAVRRLNRTVAQFAYRLALARDRSSDDLVRTHAAKVPTVAIDIKRSGRKIEIEWRHIFGRRPSLQQFIDTPEKAARLEAIMTTIPSNESQ